MARIRSIHPGLFSDPEFAALSSDAQVFYLGLLTEADDNGIFEWNANKLKIRLRPLKDGSIDSLFVELETAEKVASYEVDGRKYGAIRNFRKFQRPKSPKATHPISNEWRIYVGLSPSISEMPPDEASQFPPDGEIPPQREEEGGRREGEFKNPATPTREDLALAEWQSGASGHGWRSADFMTSTRRFKLAAVLDAYGGLEGWKRILEKASEAGLFLDEDGKYHPWFSLDWLLDQDRIARLLEGAYAERKKQPQAQSRYGKSHVAGDTLPSAEPWEQRMRGWHSRKQWLPQIWGPPPGASGCRVPSRFMGDA